MSYTLRVNVYRCVAYLSIDIVFLIVNRLYLYEDSILKMFMYVCTSWIRVPLEYSCDGDTNNLTR